MSWEQPKLKIDRKYNNKGHRTDDPELDKDVKPKYYFAWQEDLDYIIIYEDQIFDMYESIIKAKKEYKKEEK